MAREWKPVSGTRNWVLTDTDGGMIVRHITVRDPYLNETAGTKYEVTGEGHAQTVHAALLEAKAAAEASLATMP